MRLYEVFKRETTDQSIPYDEREDQDLVKYYSSRENQLVGPHEGRVLNLMLKGKKPAALLDSEKFQTLGFQEYVDDGTFVADRLEPIDHVVVTQPDEAWRISQLKKLYSQIREYHREGKEDVFDAKVGILLGYSNEEIRELLRKNKERRKNR